jgi:hypothetical protein
MSIQGWQTVESGTDLNSNIEIFRYRFGFLSIQFDTRRSVHAKSSSLGSSKRALD